ncbi:MAG: Winged helix DNA-binding domain [Bacteroidota bacterium]|jgi:DNA-binding MarR family transcriptional regulator
MYENFLLDILNYANNSKETKQAALHWLWGNIDRRRLLLFKDSFRDTEINSIDEFALLNLISIKKRITHTQACNYLFLERSTVSEMFKRFCFKSIIVIECDNNDRRIKFISLTKKGVELVNIANTKMMGLNRTIFGQLVEENLFLEELKNILEIVDNKINFGLNK